MEIEGGSVDDRVPVKDEEFGVLMPPNARIGTMTFDDTSRQLHVQLADGGDERIVPAYDVRALHGARIRHVSVTAMPPKAKAPLNSAAVLVATGLPLSVPSPRRGDTSIQKEEAYYALALRLDRLPELWYLVATSFNFRKALGRHATYSTELNLREFVKRLSAFAPDAVRDGFFTATLAGSPLPPPVESLLEFFRIVSR